MEDRYKSTESRAQVAARKAAAKAAQIAGQVQQQAQAAAKTADVQGWVDKAQRTAEKLWKQQSVYSVGISGRQQAYGGGSKPSASAFGWVPLALAGGVVFLLMFGSRIRLPWGRSRRSSGGRWVMDRSLGGKMIFIPNGDPLPSSATSSTRNKQPRSLWNDDEAGSGATASATAANEEPWLAAPPPPAPVPEEPEWWQPPRFNVYATPDRKQELQRQARGVLRELEDAKLLQGVDYPLSGLVALRTLCQEAGGYQVRPTTSAGRDAILRAGVKAAISAAQEGLLSMLGGDHPAKFVCGLAHDLGVPDKRAVTIVHAEVAATCRSALIDAEAAYRLNNTADILLALIRMGGTLQTFPLPHGSAEAELVAAGITKQTSLEFRKAIFFEFGAVSPDLASLAAELLGFSPDLVMPVLRQRQAAAAAAATQQNG